MKSKINREKRTYTIFLIVVFIFYWISSVEFSAFVFLLGLLYLISAKISVCAIKGRIKWSVQIQGELSRGEKTQGRLIFENDLILPILGMEYKLRFSNLLTDESYVCEGSSMLLPKRKREVFFSLCEEYTGLMNLEVAKCTVKDPLNLFSKDLEIISDIPARTMILPRIRPLEISQDSLEMYDIESFKFSQHLKGTDTSETIGIKEYKAGDSIKTIHWKLSSKLDEIVIRELGYPVDNKLLLLLDKSSQSRLKEKEIEEVIDLFSSLSYELASKEINHTLGWYDFLLDKFICNYVDSQDQVISMLPSLIGSPIRKDEQLTSVKFIEDDCEKIYSCIIFVTSRDDAEVDMENLRNYGEVIIYRPKDFK